MIKEAPSFGRIFAMVAFTLSCFGILVFLWLNFGGSVPLQPKGYRVNVSFPEATQLVQEAEVRISGVRVGQVKKKEPNAETGLTETELQIDARYAPIPKDTRAILRQKTLLGETYVELSPGTKSSGMAADGGELPPGQVSETVELDEILRTFDPVTRQKFSIWFDQAGLAARGRAEPLNDALGQLTPFAEETDDVLEVLRVQSDSTKRFIRDTGVVFDALTERQRPAPRPDQELEPGLERGGVARRGAGRDLPGAPDLPAREPRDHAARDGVRREDRSAHHAAAAGGAPTVAAPDRRREARARPQDAFR